MQIYHWQEENFPMQIKPTPKGQWDRGTRNRNFICKFAEEIYLLSPKYLSLDPQETLALTFRKKMENMILQHCYMIPQGLKYQTTCSVCTEVSWWIQKFNTIVDLENISCNGQRKFIVPKNRIASVKIITLISIE